MERVILHIDMDAYFASVEQQTNPVLRGKPVGVCGEGRTIITAASYEAKKFGVKTAMTIPEARKLCPGIILVPGNLDKYVDTSLRIHKIFLKYTDQVEVFSIDECFLDITHQQKQGISPVEISRKIKKELKEELGLTCSVGIGPNKVVSKLASKLNKPDGLVEVKAKDVPGMFSRLKIEKLQGVGVGARLSAKLKSLGLETAKQLGDAPLDMLNAHFGIMGHHLKRTGQGENDSPVRKYTEYEQIKSIGHSHTLPQDTFDLKVIKSYLRMLSEKAGTRLREANLTGRTVSLIVRYSDFYTFCRQSSLKHYIRTGYDIYLSAYGIFERLLPLKKAVRLIGVSISNLTMFGRQEFLLESMEKQQKLTSAVDSINKKYGEFKLKPSNLIIAEKFGIQERCGLIGKYLWRK